MSIAISHEELCDWADLTYLSGILAVQMDRQGRFQVLYSLGCERRAGATLHRLKRRLEMIDERIDKMFFLSSLAHVSHQKAQLRANEEALEYEMSLAESMDDETPSNRFNVFTPTLH